MDERKDCDARRWSIRSLSGFLTAGAIAALGVGLSGATSTTTAPAAASSPGTTRDYVITYFYDAITPNAEKDDCPQGLAQAPDPAAYFKDLTPAQLKDLTTKSERQRELYDRMNHRGPGGASICESPTLEPGATMPAGQSKLGWGLHLDGGNASASAHCPHDELTSPDGLQHVNNQLERFYACIQQRRQNGYLPPYEVGLMRAGEFTLLIQVSGVHDFQNDDHVQVVLAPSIDPLVSAPDGKTPIQHASYTVSDNATYHNVLTGRIKDGVLETDPHDVRLPSNEHRKEEFFHDAQLRLSFQADGTVKGLLGGYRDIETFYRQLSQGGTAGEFLAGPYSCSGVYNLLRSLADGYPDPKTGQCTAISSAMKIEAVPAFAVAPTTRAAAPPPARAGTAAGGRS
jgi:hypothetical protein